MKVDSNFSQNLLKLKNFLIKRYGFISIEGKNISNSISIEIENELHLINKEWGLHIDIEKYIDDNDVEITIRGNSNQVDEISNYVDFFLNKQKLIDAGALTLIANLEAEVYACFDLYIRS